MNGGGDGGGGGVTGLGAALVPCTIMPESVRMPGEYTASLGDDVRINR